MPIGKAASMAMRDPHPRDAVRPPHECSLRARRARGPASRRAAPWPRRRRCRHPASRTRGSCPVAHGARGLARTSPWTRPHVRPLRPVGGPDHHRPRRGARRRPQPVCATTDPAEIRPSMRMIGRRIDAASTDDVCSNGARVEMGQRLDHYQLVIHASVPERDCRHSAWPLMPRNGVASSKWGSSVNQEAMIQEAIREAEAERRRPVTRQKVGRNEPCPCGSGRKYKKCCGAGGEP